MVLNRNKSSANRKTSAMKVRYFIFVALIFVSSCGRDAAVNRHAFHPEVTRPHVWQPLPEGVREVYIKTNDDVYLQCFFLPHDSSRNIALFFHGNSGNVYRRMPELLNLSATGLNVLGVGYRGYGKSTGKPTEKGIYEDGASALKYAMETLDYSYSEIFLYGRSLGTLVALETARNKKVAGIILVTPLTSGREITRAHGMRFLSLFVGDVLNNMKKLPDIVSPVMIIHGDADKIVPWEMGNRIYESLTGSRQMITIINGRHNNLEEVNPALYWNSISEFVLAYGAPALDESSNE